MFYFYFPGIEFQPTNTTQECCRITAISNCCFKRDWQANI